MDQANITWRIGVDQWLEDDNFEKFASAVKAHKFPGKIAFFTCPSHVPLRLEIQYQQMDILKKRIAVMQKMGYVTGINQLCTLGHLSEDVEMAEPCGSLYTAINGDVAPGCRCPSDPEWLNNYVTPLYKRLAETGADFIYADDDIRLGAHGLSRLGCFCPVCMEKLNSWFGVDFKGSHEALIEFFEDPAEGEARKAKMLDYNRQVLKDLCTVIERAVHSVNPRIAIGFMDGARSWEGNARPECYEAFAGPDKAPVYWRPGGSCYDDRDLDELLGNLNHIGYQCATIPQEVEVLESEVENFNYQKFNKSIAFNCLESAVDCAAGATGNAYNVIPFSGNDDVESWGERVDAIIQQKEFLDEIVSRAGRLQPQGIYDCAGGRNSFLMHNRNFARWMDSTKDWPKSFHNSDLQKMGLPVAYSMEAADFCAVGGNSVYGMTDSEIKTMLTKGAYLDPLAVKALWDRGYGEDTGFRIAGEHTKDVYEKYTAHPLNGKYAGKLRSGRMSFWYEPAVYFEALPGAETVCTYVKQLGEETNTVSSGYFVNRFGGRILVEGYYPWSMYFFESAVQRIKGIFEYLSQNRLSGYVKSCHRTALFIRGEGAVSVLNMSLDPAKNLILRLKTEKTHLAARQADGTRYEVTGADAGNGYKDFTVPCVKPWSLLFCHLG